MNSAQLQTIFVLLPEARPFYFEQDMRQLMKVLHSPSFGGERLAIVYPPFYQREPVPLQVLRDLGTQLKRVHAQALVDRWLQEEIEPLLEACRSPLMHPIVDYPATLSWTAAERYLIACIQRFDYQLAHEIHATSWARSPAKLHIDTGRLTWTPPQAFERIRGHQPLALISGCMLSHVVDDPTLVHIQLPNSTLLPPGDFEVLRLAMRAHPNAECVIIGNTSELPFEIDRLLPAGVCAKTLPFLTAP